ncbi:helix-turn-helix transcriptional regulator [Pseudomonas sp. 51_B]|uniref:helix-turn-helix domain-containing protein n=1 Tax=Pseudomonas sp. 51_B TaxID=2813573 RepID=UPI001FAED489|nr:helix-turn-helix transcriptional regulator [Pseudomonas sp. 51_B]
MDHLPLSFRDVHSAPARELLGWSIEDLSSASGVSPQAIQRLEGGASLTSLRTVSMHALAFALEAEGLVFFPGHPPLRGMNCRGSTKDPQSRSDFHLLE